MINKIVNLPTLTSSNKKEFLDWHNYYEKVYKKKVTHDVNLNNFNWFYWYSPLGNINVFKINDIKQLYNSENIPDIDIPYITTYGKEYSAETQLSKAGFFVRRKEIIITDNYIEVYRTNISKFTEYGVCWFFLTIGSGIYLKYDKSFIGSRDDFGNWIENNPYKSLKNKGIQTFLINNGWCSSVNLIEIVYLLNGEKTPANTSTLPLFKGDNDLYIEYNHSYDSLTNCMV